MTSAEACIALNMLPTMGPVQLRKLLEVFETPKRILGAPGSELRTVDGIGSEVAGMTTRSCSGAGLGQVDGTRVRP